MASVGAQAKSCCWLLLLCFFSTQGNAQDANCNNATEQPVFDGIDPPAGNSTIIYRIFGELLDQVTVAITADGAPNIPRIVERNSSEILFRFGTNATSLRTGTTANVSLRPNNSACETFSRTVSLHRFPSLSLRTDPVQPGTVIYTLPGTCLPSVCGDNSTDYNITVGQLQLERLDIGSTSSSTDFAARFPNFDTPVSRAGMVIHTQYQQFDVPEFFDLELAGSITEVNPQWGQRGTNVVIRGTRLLGGVRSNEVTGVTVQLGDTAANVTGQSSNTEIRVTVNSGTPGIATVRINTTQTIQVSTLEMFSFDGPYTYRVDAWTQLQEGQVTNIVPLAAQPGREVMLCGDRLLGGGTRISIITLAGQTISEFSPTPFNTTGNLTDAGSECISISLPVAAGGTNDIATLVANTGAIVDSTQTFTYAAIRNVSPMRGQFGTRVTISGVSLLSGYSSETPQVYLSGIQARVLSSSSSSIMVEAQMPPEMDLGSAQPMAPQTIFGVSGSIEIVVNSPFSDTFNVSTDSAWTYERPGQIGSVNPPFGQFGTRVTIQGDNLLGYGTTLTRATLNDTDAVIVEASNATVVLTAPDLDSVGPVTIALFSDTGAVVRGEELFEYRQRGAILAADPSSGQNGTYVNIIGTNLFGHGNNITNVSFLGIWASIDYSQINNTVIRVRVDANSNTVDTPAMIRIVADTSAIVQSNGSIWTYLVEGRVTNVMPSEGQEGTRVNITGTNLLGGGSNVSEIFLDGVQGRVESASSTRVTVVMGGIGTRRSDFYARQVYIMADTGAVVTGGQYQHRVSGVITSFFPPRGRQGTRIVLTGTNLLGYGDRITSVEVAGATGMVERFANTEVTIRAGVGLVGMQGRIQLTINTGATVSSLQNFTYEQSGTITSIDPQQGAEGSGVLIRGQALWPSTTRIANITFGGSPVSRIVTESQTEISIIAGAAPEVNPDNAEVVITARDGSFVSGQNFSYQNLTISLRNRDRGQEGTLIEVSLPSLSSFDPSLDLRATIDDQAAQTVSFNAINRYITIMVPRATRAGMYTADVAVENLDRLVARLRDGFTYLPEGVIYSVTPNVGQRGTRVVLEGENLLGGGDFVASATLAGVSTTVQSNTSEIVELEVAANPTGTFPILGDIVLIADTDAIVRRLRGFTLVQPGRITSVSPTIGQFGTRVSITGSNLLQNASLSVSSVTLAGVEASIIGEPSDSQIMVQAQDGSGGVSGMAEIILVSGAEITSDTTFQYLERGQITRVTPENGTVGTRVEITGTNLLGGGTTATEVFLDGVRATIVSSNSTSVNVIANESTPGRAGSVEIISSTGANVTGVSLWSYEDLGNITSVDPPVGQQGVEVRIAGNSLLGGLASQITSCFLADVPGEVISFSNEFVVCRAGFNLNASSGNVRLTTDTGPVIRSDVALTFTYYAASIDSIEPTNGTNGTYVNISGLNLFSFSGGSFSVESVMFGSVNVTEITVTSGNDIRVRVGPSNVTYNDTVRVISTSGAFVELENAWSYTEPGRVMRVEPVFGFPGDTITITGDNLVAPCVPGVRVILGQTESYTATIINTSAVEFRPGVYQASNTSNLDNPQEALPIQIIASDGATVFTEMFTFRYNATGEITFVNPDAGGIGSEVVITGMNLLGDGNVSQVVLAGVPVNEIVNATDTEITVIARVGPNMGTSGGVVIETDDGRLTGIAGNAWTYFPIIQASDVTPQTGQNGTSVSISIGGRVPSSYIVEEVTLAGVSSSPVSSSATTVQRRAGPSINTPLSNITIMYSGGNTGLGATVTIVNAWSYQRPVQVVSVSPMQGYFNTLVVIRGANFQPGGVPVTEVYLANIATTIESRSDTELRVRIAEMRNSSTGQLTGPIVIRSQNGAIFTSQTVFTEFTYVQVRVDSVNPETGQQGTRVTIRGINLLAGGASITNLTLGGILANISGESNSEISAVAEASPMATNISDISYTVNTGARVRIPNRWQYVAPGTITGVSPSEGNRGTVVTITGSGMFGGGGGAAMVLLNTIPASEILVNDTNLIQVVAGASSTALSAGRIQIIADTGAFVNSELSEAAFTYLGPGTVSFSPLRGQNGTRVTLSGMRFHNGEGIRRVTLAGVEATIEGTPTATSILVRAGRPSRLESFQGPVIIESSLGTITESTTNFIYLEEGLILSVTPTRGQNGTNVYIEGEGLFGGGTRVQSVYLAGVMATVDGMTSTSINVTAGGQVNATTGDILIISNTGAYVRRINGWTYVQQGVITAIDPPQGQYGTMIIIRGERLTSGGDSVQQVFIDDVLANGVVSMDNGTVVARAGEPQDGEAFNGTVTLISNDGGRLESDIEWSYLNQSNITDVTPQNGTGNTSVTVRGMRLLGGGERIARVFVAGIEALQILEDRNDSFVRFQTGINPNGTEIIGDIMLESDTGALTILERGWTYDSECPAGQFGSLNNCTLCDPECESCSGPTDTDCFVCSNFRVVLSNSVMRCVSQCPNVSTLSRECRDACELNQYARVDSAENTTFCYNCSSLCDPNLGCSGPEPTQCGRCANVFDTNSSSCARTCPEGTFTDESNRCIPCDSQCTRLAGCTGPGPADCNQCANVQISATLIDNSPGDMCLGRCPTDFFLDETRFCQPCAAECAGNCTGPTPFDCVTCRNFSFVYPNNTRQCVATCNEDPNQHTMYSDMSGRCLPCHRRCSRQGGCWGPTAQDCNGCALYMNTMTPLPTSEGECVLACNSTSFNDSGVCESCDPSCTDGCTSSGPEGCSVPDRFAAGAGAIAVFVVITIILVIIIVLLVAFLVWKVYKTKKYPVTDQESFELTERYTRKPSTTAPTETTLSQTEKKEKPVEKLSATGPTSGGAFVPEEGVELYTEMGPDEVDNQQPAGPQRSEGVTGSQDLYTDMEAPTVEVQPPIRPPKPEEKPPAKAPEEKKPPPPLPSPEKSAPPRPPPPEPEVYTEMDANVQEVYFNAGVDEEYSEMASPGVEEFYEDAGSVQPTPSKSTDEMAPLLDQSRGTEPMADALYEDTEVAAAEAERYRQVSTSNVQPPALPSRPAPKKRVSEPLPPTPLQKSLQGSASHAAIKQPIEEMYVEAGPIEESLYEAIPGHERLIPDALSNNPGGGRGGRGGGKGGKAENPLPLPPKPK